MVPRVSGGSEEKESTTSATHDRSSATVRVSVNSSAFGPLVLQDFYYCLPSPSVVRHSSGTRAFDSPWHDIQLAPATALMAFPVTCSDMDRFLLSPTSGMATDQYAESCSSNPSSRQGSVSSSALVVKNKTLPPAKSSLSEPLNDQHSYHPGYTSDEEALSSVDSDTMSISSASSGEILEIVPTRLSIVSAEEVARSCNAIENPVHCAQVVVLKAINHGDVCMSPRLVNIPAISPRSQQPDSFRPPTSRLQKLDMSKVTRHHRSIGSTPRTSLEDTSTNDSAPSTPPTSVDERSPISLINEKVLRRKSAVAGMRGARREHSLRTDSMPNAQTLREFLDSEPSYTSAAPKIPPIPQQPTSNPSKRKLRKFSSSFSLGRFNPALTRRKTDSVDTSSDEMPSLTAQHRQTLPPATYIPSRGSSLRPQSAKMVPRGGNERAPPIVLPPCPDDSDDDSTFTFPAGRNAPKSYSPTGAPKPGRKLHRRQRSASADDVMLAG